MSSPVLSYPILFCPDLLCHILSYPILLSTLFFLFFPSLTLLLYSPTQLQIQIQQTDFYVVSEDETLPKTQMPLGMEGELWIGGIGVAKGYLHAPDLTKEVVRLPQPLSTADCRMRILSTDRNLHHSNSHSHSHSHSHSYL